jgi:hypothetical protein
MVIKRGLCFLILTFPRIHVHAIEKLKKVIRILYRLTRILLISIVVFSHRNNNAYKSFSFFNMINC